MLRTCTRRVLPIVTASTIGFNGLADVATATAGSMASRGLAMWEPLDRAAEVARKVYHSSKNVKPRTASNVISDTLVNKIVGVESGGRNDARNPNSSALGQGQFIRSTWLGMVRKYRPQWAEGLTAAQILEKRKDAGASRWAIKAYAEENAPKLKRAGVGVDEASLYLAHMFDGSVAVKLYKAKPDTAVKNVVGAAAFKSNRKLLAGKKVKHIIAWAQAKMGDGEVAPITNQRVGTDT